MTADDGEGLSVDLLRPPTEPGVATRQTATITDKAHYPVITRGITFKIARKKRDF